MTEVESGTVLGRYRLENKIGEGGYATVFAARGPCGELVAVKVIHLPAGDAPENIEMRNSLRTRLSLEIKALRMINSPHIVRYVDHQNDEETPPHLVMSLVPGKCLYDILSEQGGVLPALEALDYARQLCLALVAAHSKECVHRDVKPENAIMGERLVLVDFGTVVINGSNGHLTNSVEAVASGALTALGTPNYMAPEQALGKPVKPACDLFAVGVTLYEMLTGQKLYVGFETAEAYKVLMTNEQSYNQVVANYDQRVIKLLPEISYRFPDSLPTGHTLSLMIAAEGWYEIDPNLTAGFGERVQQLLERLTAYYPEERPTAAEAATELEEIILEMSSPKQQTHEQGAGVEEVVLEAEEAPEYLSATAQTQSLPHLQRSPRAVLALFAAMLAMGGMLLVLAFSQRTATEHDGVSQQRVSQSITPILPSTKPPEMSHIEPTINTELGCRVVQRHGRPRKVCPHPAHTVRRHERLHGRRRR